jgi:DNA-binding protein H-NS
MAKTYQQLQAEIEQLQKKAEAQRKKELTGVIKEIKDAIAHWGLTAEDLGFGVAKPSANSRKTAKQGRSISQAKRQAKSVASAVKYRDENGNVWGGRGPRPAWLRAAIEAGRTPEEFLV